MAAIRTIASSGTTKIRIILLFGVSRSDFLTGRDLTLCLNDDLNAVYTTTGKNLAWLHISCGMPDASGRYPLFIGAMPNQELWGDAGAPSARPPDYLARKAAFIEKISTLIRQAVPELADLEIVESASEYTLRDWIYGCSGSIYGALHSADNFPVLPFTHIQGLSLAGQSVILPGLLGAFVSVAAACGTIVGYHQLFRDLACTNAE
ncbi:MAG: hypothetical protein LBV80_09550 [Deltaproteobacteria bacterium]|nr:hypothetical protein [Deltaproteobacteria bacterium]